MFRTRTIVAATAAAALGFAPLATSSTAPAGGATPVPTDVVASLCAADPTAAVALVTEFDWADVVRTRVLGTDVTVVVDPMIPPGIPTALLDTSQGLCTVDTFNLTVAPTLGDAAAVASVFASVAGMQWLGDVDVRDVLVDGDTVTLTTFGGRHHVTSDWTVVVDAAGVREASFETTAFGTDLTGLQVADLEGLTSRPGHGRSWTRDATGLLAIDATIADDLVAARAERLEAARHAAEVTGRAPGDFLEFTGDDGQVVRVTLGYAPTGVETPASGVPQADRLTHLFEGLRATYEDFVSWGLDDPWDGTNRTYLGVSTPAADEAGYINISSGFSAVCLACAVITDGIEVHAEYAFPEVAQELVGVSYPDAEDFFVDVMGHELVHSMQGGYGEGSTRGLTNAFIEATARASETLYRGAENTHQHGSIQYVDNANGCEGFENGRGGWLAAQAAGPFSDGHTYDSCYFWWTYYAQHGGAGLIRVLESMPAAGDGSSAARNLRVLDAASPDGDGTPDLAFWAAAYAAGPTADGFTIVDANGVSREWLGLMRPALRSRGLRSGASASVSVSNGGTAAFVVDSASATVAELPAGAEAFLFSVVDGAIVAEGPLAVGDVVVGDQIIAVVAPDDATHTGAVALR